MTPEQKEFIKLVENGARRHGRDYWNDFLELAFTALRNRGDFKEDVEAQYMKIVKKYQDRDDEESIRVHFPKMLGLLGTGLAKQPSDFLGEVAGAMEVLSKQQGQFFTPYALSKTCALMSLDKKSALKIIKEKGCITIHEPAVGAGGMLIAALEIHTGYGIDPKHIYFNAWDVSMPAVQMAYIQLGLMGAVADIVHGNTLSLEQWGSYPTPVLTVMRALRPMPAPGKRNRPPPSTMRIESLPDASPKKRVRPPPSTARK